jgi:hypothetical protein
MEKPLITKTEAGFALEVSVNFTRESIMRASVRKRLKAPSGISQDDWNRRTALFSRFDEGIKMDCEAWFEVTPENVALWLAHTLRTYDFIVDACCGVGGNTIQFARYCTNVTGIDTNPCRINMAQHNSRVYAVSDRIRFIECDVMAFLECQPPIPSSAFYISPPWGGKSCYSRDSVGLDDLPMRLTPIIDAARERFETVIVHLPRNCEINVNFKFYKIIKIFYSNNLKFKFLILDEKLSISQNPSTIMNCVLNRVYWRGLFYRWIMAARQCPVRGVQAGRIGVEDLEDFIGQRIRDNPQFFKSPVQFLLDRL